MHWLNFFNPEATSMFALQKWLLEKIVKSSLKIRQDMRLNLCA